METNTGPLSGNSRWSAGLFPVAGSATLGVGLAPSRPRWCRGSGPAFRVLRSGSAAADERVLFPADLVKGTPVEDPANEPWPGGTMAQLGTLGVEVTRIEESVRARMPTPDERRTLQIAQGVPVLTVTRRMLDHDRPVEAAMDTVMPADRFVLDYSMDLS
jgi:hypothetical protein